MGESRSRKWQLTINNPAENGFDHSTIKEKLSNLKSVVYWCLCDEIGEQGTPHTHIYLAASNAIRFSTLKNLFPAAHMEVARGTSQENRDYVRKEGKYKDSEKAATNLIDTFEEEGELPQEHQGERSDMSALYDLVKEGLSDYEIIEQNPRFLLRLDSIESARQMLRYEKFKNDFRNLRVSYIYGSTGVGKTRSVMDEYGYSNVYRVTDYDHPFDGYKGQDVIIFEEFRSSLKIQDMLNFLDGYPVELPCRYTNKIACFTKVYIITNIPLKEQYANVQRESPETWKAFLRRIHGIYEYTKLGKRDVTEWEQLTLFG